MKHRRSSAEAAKPLGQAQGRSLSPPGLLGWFSGFCTTLGGRPRTHERFWTESGPFRVIASDWTDLQVEASRG